VEDGVFLGESADSGSVASRSEIVGLCIFVKILAAIAEWVAVEFFGIDFVAEGIVNIALEGSAGVIRPLGYVASCVVQIVLQQVILIPCDQVAANNVPTVNISAFAELRDYAAEIPDMRGFAFAVAQTVGAISKAGNFGIAIEFCDLSKAIVPPLLQNDNIFLKVWGSKADSDGLAAFRRKPLPLPVDLVAIKVVEIGEDFFDISADFGLGFDAVAVIVAVGSDSISHYHLGSVGEPVVLVADLVFFNESSDLIVEIICGFVRLTRDSFDLARLIAVQKIFVVIG